MRLKQRYLRLFFEAFVVRDRCIERVIPTPFFHWLQEVKKVRANANWYPLLELTRTTIAALESQTWIFADKQLHLACVE